MCPVTVHPETFDLYVLNIVSTFGVDLYLKLFVIFDIPVSVMSADTNQLITRSTHPTLFQSTRPLCKFAQSTHPI